MMVLTTFGFVIAERATNDYPRELSEALTFDTGATDQAGGNAATLKAMNQAAAASIQADADRSFTEALALVVEAGFTGNGALLAEDALAFASGARLSATAGQAQGAALVMAASASVTALSLLGMKPANADFTASAAIQLTGNVAAVELFQAIAVADLAMDSDAVLKAVLPFGAEAAFDMASGRLVDDFMAFGVACDLAAADRVTLSSQIQFTAAANLVALGLTRAAKDMELAAAAGLDCSSFRFGPPELMQLAAAARLSAGGFKLHELNMALEVLADMSTLDFITSKPIEGVCNVAGFILQNVTESQLAQGGILAASLEAHQLLDQLNQAQAAQFRAGAMPQMLVQGSANTAGQARGAWFMTHGRGVSVTPGQASDSMASGEATARQSGGVSFFRFLRCI